MLVGRERGTPLRHISQRYVQRIRVLEWRLKLNRSTPRRRTRGTRRVFPENGVEGPCISARNRKRTDMTPNEWVESTQKERAIARDQEAHLGSNLAINDCCKHYSTTSALARHREAVPP